MFLGLCKKFAGSELGEEFFELILTREEKDTFSARSLIIKALLGNEMTQREMSGDFQVSISQITRGSNALKRSNPELKKELQKFFQKK